MKYAMTSTWFAVTRAERAAASVSLRIPRALNKYLCAQVKRRFHKLTQRVELDLSVNLEGCLIFCEPCDDYTIYRKGERPVDYRTATPKRKRDEWNGAFWEGWFCQECDCMADREAHMRRTISRPVLCE